MKSKPCSDRILGYKKAREINLDSLDKVSGGSQTGTTYFTTKQTFDMKGNWDVGGDINWD
ncbi:hypothetical protein [Legionella sp. W05-934-2]|jgi:hypothetical protein|uniref:hypothetical protein n=1 Tax=Legionella sp. W05-934-2 TaxID=1198649 RepID=UPI0034631D74